MLYWLLYEKLFPFFHPFRIFRYLTFRTAFASLTALLIALFIGPYVIQKLREFQIGQFVRDDGPQSHLKKTGTPTMGGVLICIAILLPTVLWSDPANPFVWIVVFSTLAFGAIGFADDYIKVVKRRSLGLTARAKLLWQGLAGVRGRCGAGGAGPVRRVFHAPIGSVYQEPAPQICCGMHWPTHASAHGAVRVCPVRFVGGALAGGHVERREPDRRARRPGHRLHHHRRGLRSRC